MTVTHGRLTALKIGTADISAWCNNSDYDDGADTHDTTTYGSSGKKYAGGLRDGTLNFGGLYDSATGGPEAVLRPALGTTTTFEWGPEGSATGKKKVSGSGVLSAFKITNPVADMVRWTGSLKVSDVPTVATYP